MAAQGHLDIGGVPTAIKSRSWYWTVLTAFGAVAVTGNQPTRGTPFYISELPPGEFLIVFILYADTHLSTNQIAFLLAPFYKTLYERIKDTETAFLRGFSDPLGLYLPDGQRSNSGG